MTRFKPVTSVPATLVGGLPYIALFARLFSPVTANLSFIILAVYAFKGRSQAIQALALSWFFVMLNPELAPDASYSTVGRYAVLFSAAVSVAMHKMSFQGRRSDGRLMSLTILLGLFFVLHAFVFSPMLDVSLLKAVSWMVAMITLIAAWSGLNYQQSELLQRWLTGFLILILLCSLPFVFISTIGYLRNGTGFQGILSHPQAFGPAIALLAALIIGGLLSHNRPPWKAIVLVLVCIGLILISEARTAGFALFIGVVFALLIVSFLSGKTLKQLTPALRSQRFQMLIIVGLFAAVAMGSQLAVLADQFITKSGRARVSGLAEAYDDSRGLKIDEMLGNIEGKPFTGIGFGIDSNLYDMDVARDPILGLPIGASIEKGVMPMAILEEVGIPGFILVGIWIFSLFRCAAIRGVAPLCAAMVALFINMGESVLFSPGGMGMLLLIMLAWAAAKPVASAPFNSESTDHA